jgi:hypothetical protein
VQLDRQGYPVMLDMPVPPWLERGARQAVEMCPALALRLNQTGSPPVVIRSLARGIRPGGEPLAGTGRYAVPELVVSEEWIAEISADQESAPDGRMAYGVIRDETGGT